MPRACYPLVLTLLLWPSAASAQPLFRLEHDWSVTIDGRKFGVRQVHQAPGDFRHTEVWLGWCAFNIHGRAAEALALALLSPTHLVARIDRESFRRVP